MAIGKEYIIQIVGIDHRVANVSQREKCAFSKDEISSGVKACMLLPGVMEVAILSTCNRLEIVAVMAGDCKGSSKSLLLDFLNEYKNLDKSQDDIFFSYRDIDAVSHLCKVASGMESMILGEYQILSQVKDSLDLSKQAGGVDTILHGLFARVITASKRVRTDTQLGAGSVSVAGAAVDLSKKIFKNLADHSALIIGAGETGQLVGKHLRDNGIGKLYLTNRTASKAESVAVELGAEVVAFEGFANILKDVDIVVGTTSSPVPILDAKTVKAVMGKARMRPLALVDIAVPRDFEEGVGKQEFVFLHTLDDLQKLIDHTLSVRRQELSGANDIVDYEVGQFMAWTRTLDVAPTIVELRGAVMKLQEDELSRYKNKMNRDELKKCVEFSTSVLNKLLHLPTSQLKQFDINDVNDLRRLQCIRDCFGLGEDR